MEFRLLGAVEVVEGGRRLPLGGRKQRALLAALLLDANRVVPADVLVDALWGEQASARSTANLHSLVSRLRRTLGPERIERHAGGYLLRAEESEIDLHRFERLRAEARLLPPTAASERLRLALDLWRGPALADFTYDSWASAHVQRLEELRVTALEERVDADLEASRHKELIGELQALVGDHPLREGFRRQLIVALYRAGRQAEALEAYRAARRMLDEELGLEPSPALRELEAAVLRQDPALDVARPARRAVLPVPHVPHRRRRVVVVAASALLAFATAAGAAWWSNRGEDRRTEAAAARDPRTAVRAEPQADRANKKTKRASRVHRAISRPASRPLTKPQQSTRRVSAPPPTTRPVTRRAPPAAPPLPLPPPPKPPPPPAPPPPSAASPRVRVTDNFDDGVLRRDLWESTLIGSGTALAERNGRLEVELSAVAAGGGSEFAAQVQTTCSFFGDFDVRVDYELLEWPQANGVTVHLAAILGRHAIDVARQSHSWGEGYASWFTRTNRGGSAPTADVRGTLRLRRVDGRVFAYNREGTSWGAIANYFVELTPRFLLKASSTDEWFADQTVRVAFDNLVLTAENRYC